VDAFRSVRRKARLEYVVDCAPDLGGEFEAGADLAWLEASGDDSWRVYERIGFRPAGRRLYVAL
jgi:hypothetical protein